ncbi:MAG: hypothetical protein IT349_15355 [Candidatus Eisenbacteria bacterium]|nr:hypothetical protein [Candidatus Eisenbacteria bacterium]
MDVVILMVFVSLMLVVGAVVLLLNSIHGGDMDHADRLSLLPLEEDDGRGDLGKGHRRPDRTLVAMPEPDGE